MVTAVMSVEVIMSTLCQSSLTAIAHHLIQQDREQWQGQVNRVNSIYHSCGETNSSDFTIIVIETQRVK